MNHRIALATLISVTTLLLAKTAVTNALLPPPPTLKTFVNGQLANADEVNSNFNTILGRIAQVHQDLNDRLSSAEALITQIQTGDKPDVARLKADFEELQRQVQRTETNLTVLDGQLATQGADISDLRGRLVTREGQRMAFAEADTNRTLTTSWQSVLQVTIEIPSTGKVHIIGNASFELGDCNPAQFGISPEPIGFPSHITSRVEHCGNLDFASANIAATTQYITAVTPGRRTFHLVARRMLNTGGGTITLVLPQMSVTFLPD
jgi:hypothetical protein